MKKLLPLIIALFPVLKGNAQCGPLFSDDFETGAPSASWNIGSGHTMTVSSTAPAAGTYSMDMTGSSVFYSGPNVTFASSQPTYVSWWIKTNSTSVANGYFVLGDANINSDNGVLFAYCNSNSELRFFGSTGYNYPISVNTWYHVEVMNINWTARTMDIYVNSTLILTAWPFRSTTATSVDRLHLFNLNSATASYDNIQIGGGNPMVLSNTTISPLCNGNTNGSIDLTVTGGNSPFTYNWSNSATTEDLTGLGAGTYSVQVTDNIGCTGNATVTLTEPTLLQVTSSSTGTSCIGTYDGTLLATVSGGTGPYTYMWSNGGNMAAMSNISGGVYTCTVTDVYNCSSIASTIVTQPPAITTTFSNLSPLCNGDANGSITANVSGGTPGYTYAWSTGGTTSTISGLGAGSYSLTITDANNCTAANSITLTEPDPLSAVPTSTPTSCNSTCDGMADVGPMGGTAPYAYSWSPGGQTTQFISSLCPGSYTCNWNDANGCAIITTVTITAPAAITLAVTGTDPTGCTTNDGSADLTANGGTPGYTFSWSNTTTTEDLSGLGAGTYDVVVTDAAGCSDSVSVTLNNPNPPAVTIVFAQDTFCQADGAATLTGGLPAGGTWSGPGVSGSTFTPSTAGLGTSAITYTYTDAGGCTGSYTSNLYVSGCVGIAEMTAGSYSIYPNPNNGTFVVEYPSFSTVFPIVMYNALGEQTGSWMMNSNRETIDMQSLPAGIYLLQLRTPEGVKTERVVKN